ncbi:MAG: HNH endonuclease, partial [Candidatus Competibacteraceae bacterium]|nr:HNH endonuclease [Candidatus Competibacteraceae bacterium]
KLRFTGDSAEAYRAFDNGKSWQGTDKNKARLVRRSPKVKTLLRRDGGNCFYCREPLGDDITVEHLVCRAHGGPNHISNLVLAHGQCNHAAGHLSAAEKVAIRDHAPGLRKCS